MPIIIKCIIEDCSDYDGKNGWRGNIKVSQLIDKKRKFLTLPCEDKYVYNQFTEHLQENVEVTVALDESNFGLRLSSILDYNFE